MLYKKNSQSALNPDLFASPTSEYRGAPFWAWNCKLDKDTLIDQTEAFREMGMGGAHIHCRVGLDTKYLGDEFFDCVKACEESFKSKDMLCWLYDEDRWPSGSAGGYATKDTANRMCFIVLEPEGYDNDVASDYQSRADAIRSNEKKFLGQFKISLSKDGFLKSYEFFDTMSASSGDIWNIYLEYSGSSPWFNNQAYLNTLDPASVRKFINTTHEVYFKHLGKDFGETINAIFTDEPQFAKTDSLPDPFFREPLTLPYTRDFDETFKEKYGFSILKKLPELFWNNADGTPSEARYFYHRHVSERFSEAYCDQIAAWCNEHGIALTGHMMNEWTLHSQTMSIGEAMRPLMHFGLPGMDMLCDRREFSTAKQSESIAHQMGCEGVTSEIYGVTGWTFDFRGHKLAGDWQAALGVTFRAPHLAWASMEGEGKRDYPACIGYQSPWYKEYSYIENHFARLATALTRGRACVRVGMIHPIESYWMYWGCDSQYDDMRQALETRFENVISWMLFGLIDFDFISEAVLEEVSCDASDAKFKVGKASYEVVIVPACISLRKNTIERLAEFKNSGGTIVFLEKLPSISEGKEIHVSDIFNDCPVIPFSKVELLNFLAPWRDIDIVSTPLDGVDKNRVKFRDTGKISSNLFYQLREDNNCSWLFVCHVNKPVNPDITCTEQIDISVSGQYNAQIYDTLTGEIYDADFMCSDSKTCIRAYVSAHDSLLIKLIPSKCALSACGKSANLKSFLVDNVCKKYLPEPESFSLDEPNCCLLDMAEYAFDDSGWQESDELLRIDNKFRALLGYPLRTEALAQPWTIADKPVKDHILHLRFTVNCQSYIKDVLFACEHPESMVIKINGNIVDNKACGWFVDKCIKTVPIGDLGAGANIIELEIEFGEKTNIEWCYLLGNFGVSVSGRNSILTSFPSNISFGDFCPQGLPFYAGNLTYEISVDTKAGDFNIEIPRYRGSLIKVSIDKKPEQVLCLAPYKLNLGHVDVGRHIVRIKIFGNRANAFGPVHNANPAEEWYGPMIWRTTGLKWTYDYQLVRMGILSEPLYWIS